MTNLQAKRWNSQLPATANLDTTAQLQLDTAEETPLDTSRDADRFLVPQEADYQYSCSEV